MSENKGLRQKDFMRGTKWTLRQGGTVTILEPLRGGVLKVLGDDGLLRVIYPGEIYYEHPSQIPQQTD